MVAECLNSNALSLPETAAAAADRKKNCKNYRGKERVFLLNYIIVTTGSKGFNSYVCVRIIIRDKKEIILFCNLL